MSLPSCCHSVTTITLSLAKYCAHFMPPPCPFHAHSAPALCSLHLHPACCSDESQPHPGAEEVQAGVCGPNQRHHVHRPGACGQGHIHRCSSPASECEQTRDRQGSMDQIKDIMSIVQVRVGSATSLLEEASSAALECVQARGICSLCCLDVCLRC